MIWLNADDEKAAKAALARRFDCCTRVVTLTRVDATRFRCMANSGEWIEFTICVGINLMSIKRRLKVLDAFNPKASPEPVQATND